MVFALAQNSDAYDLGYRLGVSAATFLLSPTGIALLVIAFVLFLVWAYRRPKV